MTQELRKITYMIRLKELQLIVVMRKEFQNQV